MPITFNDASDETPAEVEAVVAEEVTPELPESDRLGEPGLKALQAERKANKELKAQLAELAKFKEEKESEGKTELQKLQEQLAAEAEGRQKSSLELMKLRVALRRGLTDEQSELLQGSSEEEMEEYIDRVTSAFQPKTEGTPKGTTPRQPRELHSGVQPEQSAEPDYAAIAERAFRAQR